MFQKLYIYPSKSYLYAFLAFILWGVAPLYYNQLNHVHPLELLAHRQIWSFVVICILTLLMKRQTLLIPTFKVKTQFIAICCCALLMSGAWILYLLALFDNQLSQPTLGYYINPLINVIFGVFIFKERISFTTRIAFLLAFLGMTFMIFAYGYFPWYALWLALIFSIYTAIRKKLDMDPIVSAFWETTLILPFSLLYILYLSFKDEHHFILDLLNLNNNLLLMGLGLMTTLPLVLFMFATLKEQLSKIGIFQYIEPSITLFISYFVFHEELNNYHALAFVLIWTSLIVHASGLFSRKIRIELRKV